MQIQTENGQPAFKIVITAYVDGQPVNVVFHGQSVVLEAVIHTFNVTQEGKHQGTWILPDREEPVDLLGQKNPQTTRTSWQVGKMDDDSCTIVFLLTGAGAPSEGLRGEKVLFIGETPVNQPVVGSPSGPPIKVDGTLSLQRSSSTITDDTALWLAIKGGAQAISFTAYNAAITDLVCDADGGSDLKDIHKSLRRHRDLPFNDTDAYRFLKVATEAFLLANVGSVLTDGGPGGSGNGVLRNRLGPGAGVGPVSEYLEDIGGNAKILPYLALVLQNMGDAGGLSRFGAIVSARLSAAARLSSPASINAIKEDLCENIAASKIGAPLFLELIWSYWQEEGMLVQTMNAISRRFQNVRAPGTKDPLAALEMNPLRPLNNVLWGYVQDEQHRLSVVRRAYEYDHAYGISLHGKAISDFRPADSRSRFIEAFHTLLSETAGFYRQDDDTTVIADGFQVRNAITEVHFILSEGAHNQFGDLPATARQEMMLQQWMLSRPEFQEFLPSRAMVAYPEPWMHRVEAMKNLQGWTDASILHFNRLATTGEQILLSIRYGAWNDSLDPAQAVNWARFWRPEIQSYIHAYRAVTGVDLGADAVDVRLANDRLLQPAVLLRRRLGQQKGATPAAMTATVSPMPSKSRVGR